MWLLLLATVVGSVNSQYVKTANYGVKGGYSHGQGHQYTGGDNLANFYGNNTQQHGSVYSGGQNYGSPSTPQVGVCYIEVPTASLVRNPAQVPVGNGSRSDLSRIRTCCSGYIRNIHTYLLCDPVCTQECINALCTAPDTCTCFPDHVKNAAGFCIPTCPIGCQNGNCAGGECICKDGFKLDLDGKYCLPSCQENCGGLGNCTAPNVCSCKSGYESTPRGSCHAKCDRGCDNGDCVAPNDCRCHRGFTKDLQGIKCIPNTAAVAPEHHPSNGYNPNTNYGSPNTSSYPNFPLYPTNYTCDRTNCENGDCFGARECRCHPGYTKNHQGVCVPHCAQDCGPSGRCISPNVCGSSTSIAPQRPSHSVYNSTSSGLPSDYNTQHYPSSYPSYSTNYSSNHPQSPDNQRPYYSNPAQPTYPYNGNQKPYYPDNNSPYFSTDKPFQQSYNISSDSQVRPQNPSSTNNQPPHGTYPVHNGQPNLGNPLNQSYPSSEPGNYNPNQRPTNNPYYPYYPDPSHATGSPSNPQQPGNYPGQFYQPANHPNQPGYTPGQFPQSGYPYNTSQPNQPNYTPNPSNQPNSNNPNQPGHQPGQPSPNPYQTLYPTNQLPNYPYPDGQIGNENLIPQCSQPCLNGICVEGNRCICNNGYITDSADPIGARCIPHCPGGCTNGVCSAPNFCICNLGYRKEQGVKGRSGCVKRIR